MKVAGINDFNLKYTYKHSSYPLSVQLKATTNVLNFYLELSKGKNLSKFKKIRFNCTYQNKSRSKICLNSTSLRSIFVLVSYRFKSQFSFKTDFTEFENHTGCMKNFINIFIKECIIAPLYYCKRLSKVIQNRSPSKGKPYLYFDIPVTLGHQKATIIIN